MIADIRRKRSDLNKMKKLFHFIETLLRILLKPTDICYNDPTEFQLG